ncbi:hypothetical protein CRG98_002252 [Punica granatum]|uniref:Uncharacterized protein n=1 Tax=Punica granatum TaxID=22663 RepID=A0A2I0L9C9_PUNGR|nr:hypothetical protein CRG98_002252 [Punica granatum]
MIRSEAIRLARAGYVLCAFHRITLLPPIRRRSFHWRKSNLLGSGDWHYLIDIFSNSSNEEKTRLRRPQPRVLTFATHLVKFKDLHEGSITERHHSFPPVLSQKLSALFIVPESGVFDIRRLICYILILCLFVDDFRVTANLSKDLSSIWYAGIERNEKE